MKHSWKHLEVLFLLKLEEGNKMSLKIGLGDWRQSEYWDTCRKSLDEISDPVEKFKAFDEVTDRLLTTASFEVLTKLAKDPNFYQHASQRYLTLGSLGPLYLAAIHEVIGRCQQLSETTIKPLAKSGDNRLWSICHQPESYIETKIFHVLGRIILSKNFAASSQASHPLHSISEEMWKLADFNHGSTCPCYEPLKTRFA
jgi:hypothetical protein